MALTQVQIEDAIVRARCCLADMSYKLAQKRAQGSKDADCLFNKVAVLTMYLEALEHVLECPDSGNPELITGNACNLSGISGGYCWDGDAEILYIVNADGAGVLPYEDYYFTYEFAEDLAGPWTEAVGYNEWYVAIAVEDVNFIYVRITMKCNSVDATSVSNTFQFKTSPAEYDAVTFGYATTTTNTTQTLIPETWYIREGDSLTISNLNSDFIISSAENLNTSTILATNVQTFTLNPEDAGYPTDGQQIELQFEYIGDNALLPCSIYRIIHVEIVPDPIISSTTTVVCSGASLDLTVANHVYDTYLWSTGETTDTITITDAGVYSCMVGEGGITGLIDYHTITINLDVPTPIIVNQATQLEMAPLVWLPNGTVLTLEAIDSGVFSGGYPVGTSCAWVDLVSGTFTLTTDNGTSYQVVITLPGGLGSCEGTSPEYHIYSINIITDADVVDESCGGANDGSITTTVTNSVLPESAHALIDVTFEWYDSTMTLIQTTTGTSLTDSITGLAPGDYYLDVTGEYANGLITTSGTISYTIDPASVITLNITPTNPTCPANSTGGASAFGTALMSASGGVAPYDYYLNGVFQGSSATTWFATNLPAGAYTSSVMDANGCTAIGPGFNITSPTAWSVTASETVCDGGGATGELTITAIAGGDGFYSTQEIYDGALNFVGTIGALPHVQTGLAADTYTIYLIDGSGCEYQTTVNVTTC